MINLSHMFEDEADKVVKTVTYSVSYLGTDGKLVESRFDTFAAAAGHAGALTGVFRLLNAYIMSKTVRGEFAGSCSGLLYKYNKDTSERIKCNPSLIKEVVALEAVRYAANK